MLIYETTSTAESFLMNHAWSGARDVVKAILEYDSRHERATALATAISLLEEFYGETTYMENITDVKINDYIWFQLADDLEDFGIKLWE